MLYLIFGMLSLGRQGKGEIQSHQTEAASDQNAGQPRQRYPHPVRVIQKTNVLIDRHQEEIVCEEHG